MHLKLNTSNRNKHSTLQKLRKLRYNYVKELNY